jgi:2-keto-3-deoxy-L-rhamnonate aldolase RhmA
MDLSFSAGFPAKTTHRKVQGLIQKVADAGAAAGIKTGIHSPVPLIGHYAEMGFKFIATGGDTDFLLDGAKEAVRVKQETLGARARRRGGESRPHQV